MLCDSHLMLCIFNIESNEIDIAALSPFAGAV